MPQNVNQAITTIWAIIAISAITAVIDKRTGAISSEAFTAYIFGYVIICLVPYKLSKGSNRFRYLFTMLIIASYLLMLGGETEEIPKLDLIESIFLIPAYIFVFKQLFSDEANKWFSK